MSPRSIEIMVWRDEEDCDADAETLAVSSIPGTAQQPPMLVMELKMNSDGLTVPPVTMELTRDRAEKLFAYIGAWLHHPSSTP